MKSEIWVPVLGWAKHYEVSSFGRIRSLRTGRCLKPSPNTVGYPSVVLWVNWRKPSERKKTVQVHRVVLESFTGTKPKATHESYGCHKDGDKTNNRRDNLYWATPSQNQHDRTTHGRAPIGTSHHAAKLNPDKVREIRKLLRGGAKRRAVARQFGIRVQSLMALESGRTWKHVTDSTPEADK